jgi:dolichol-phosphate mannosyltransferase
MSTPIEPRLSVVVPVKDEADNILPLIAEIDRALTGVIAHEIIYVDDGSGDATPARLAEAQAQYAQLRRIRHERSSGQSAATRTGVAAARAPWIVTLDGDGQNDPADIPKLLALRPSEDDAAMIAGQRVKRRDTAMKRLQSRIANAYRRLMLGDGVSDTGCALKLFRRADFLALPYFDHMHRFLPALMQMRGVRIVQVPVGHRPRAHGATKYGMLNRLFVGIVDIFGVMWLRRRQRRPGRVEELRR